MGLFSKTRVKQVQSLTGQGLQRFLMINTAVLQINLMEQLSLGGSTRKQRLEQQVLTD
jgi:hypothetical protein